MRDAIAVVAENWASVPLVALLRNRNVSLARPRAEIGRLTDLVELGLLRGQRLAPGPEGLKAGLAASLAGGLDHPARKLTETEAEAVADLIEAISSALGASDQAFRVEGLFRRRPRRRPRRGL